MSDVSRLVGIGLLGAGRIGNVHARAVAMNPAARLVAVADVFENAATAVAEPAGADVRTIEEILRSDDVDAVIIATPNDTHADLIERAIAAGKVIFCEKPIDLSLARTRACLDVISAAKAPVMVGFNRRFDPHFREVKAKIDAGAIGDVESVTITSRDNAPASIGYLASSGGLFRDMAIHDFDMARHLLGDEPTDVFATGSVLIDPAIGELGDVDSASIVLRTASGRMAQISNSRRTTYGYDQRIEVHGSQGRVAAQNLATTTVELANAAGTLLAPAHEFFMTRYQESYAAEIAAFVDLVVNGGDPSPSADDGLRALVLADAALRSHQERRLVNVDEI